LAPRATAWALGLRHILAKRIPATTMFIRTASAWFPRCRGRTPSAAPAEPMLVDDYQRRLAATRSAWKIIPEDPWR
jgi:hypothetical protein